MSGISDDELLRNLTKYFKHTKFKSEKQKNAIKAILERKKDCYVSMPTGSGKSLCYHLPGAMQENKVTIVFEPLLALMKNQLDYLRSLKIPAETINSNTSSSDRSRIIGDLKAKVTNTKFLYITPEQAATDFFKDLMQNLVNFRKIAYVAVDEAHCVSEWGHDFRKDYMKLGKLREEYPEIPWIALTATAPEKVKKDLIKNLGLKGPPEIIQVSCFRSNLYYDIAFKNLMEKDFVELKQYIEKCLGRDKSDLKPGEKSCAIIYCRKIDQTESVARALRSRGMKAGAFHSKLKKHEKEQLQNDWMNGLLPVIVATVSFGMGIDKAQVRLVIHWDVPQSISNWYQESGRAGRDGKYSFCRVYYDRDEVKSILWLLKQEVAQSKNKTNAQLEMAKSALQEFEKISNHCESINCRHKLFTNFFGDEAPNCDSMCDACKDKKKCGKTLEQFQMVTSGAGVGSFLARPDLDPADLYEGGRGNDYKKGSFEDYEGEVSAHGGFCKASELKRGSESEKSFLDKQFALRKLQATKAMEDLPKTQINRVKAAQSTEVKVAGLKVSTRDSSLTFIIDSLKKNVSRSAEKEPPEHPPHSMHHDNLETIAVQIEYECFNVCKAISIYRRNVSKAAAAIKSHDGLYPAIKSFVPVPRQSHGGEHRTVMKEMEKKYGADVVAEMEAEAIKKNERRKKNKLEGPNRDGLSQLKINKFFGEKSKSDPMGVDTKLTVVSVKEEIPEPTETSSSSNDSEIAKLECLKEVIKKELEETVLMEIPAVEEEPKPEVIPMIMQSDEEENDAPLIIDESPIDKGDGFAIESMKRKIELSVNDTTSSSKRPKISETSSSKSREFVKKIISQMVIKELNPYYNNKKFGSKDPKSLFKTMAREVTHYFFSVNPQGHIQKPEVKSYIGKIFKLKGTIKSEDDFKQFVI